MEPIAGSTPPESWPPAAGPPAAKASAPGDSIGPRSADVGGPDSVVSDTGPAQGIHAPDHVGSRDRDRPRDFDQRLAALCADREIRRFAFRHAGDRDVAEDAIHEAYCAIADFRDPASIKDLRRYFCRTLRNVIIALNQVVGAGPAPTGDLDAVLAARAAGARRRATRTSVPEEQGVLAAQASAWPPRLAENGISVPKRSPDPGRYQTVVVEAAQWVLRLVLEGDVSTADVSNQLMRLYPEWFAPDGATSDNHCQRLSRGRNDLANLLASVIGRDELLPLCRAAVSRA